MKTAIALSNSSNALKNDFSALEEVKSWIDSNTLLQNHNYIWKIGIAHRKDIMSIAGEIKKGS